MILSFNFAVSGTPPIPPDFVVTHSRSNADQDILEKHPKLNGVHDDLILLHEYIDSLHPHIVFTGPRTCKDQKKLCKKKKSKICDCSRAKHVQSPALATDSVPVLQNGKLGWEEHQALIWCGYIKSVADFIALPTRVGCAWNGGILHKKKQLLDAFHIELVEESRSSWWDWEAELAYKLYIKRVYHGQ